MKRLAATALLLIPSAFAHGPAAQAADPTTPVREVIEVSAGNWAEDDKDYQVLFTEDRLKRLFSADFAAVYHEASKHPAYDEGQETGNPFDYDPIAQGQDGCPFEDIRIENDGDGQVTALFKNHKCFGDDAEYQDDTVLIFHVQAEQGRQVIDDIYPVADGESGESLKDEMRAIAAQ